MWLAKLPLGTSVHSQPHRRNDQIFCHCGLWGPVYSSRWKWQKQLKFVSKQWSPGPAESISSLWVPVQSPPSHLSQGTSGLKERHSHPIANSYFNFFLPPPYMVLGETVKRNTWRAAGRVFLQSPHQAAGKPRVTVLPAWLRPTLHSQNSHLGPHQPKAPTPSSALPWETVKVTVLSSRMFSNISKNISFYYHIENSWQTLKWIRQMCLNWVERYSRSIVLRQKRFVEQHG